jgi:hypothetical protein
MQAGEIGFAEAWMRKVDRPVEYGDANLGVARDSAWSDASPGSKRTSSFAECAPECAVTTMPRLHTPLVTDLPPAPEVRTVVQPQDRMPPARAHDIGAPPPASLTHRSRRRYAFA